MERILFALLFFPQVAFSQYQSDIFSPNLSKELSQIKIEKIFTRDTTLVLSEKSEITGLYISGTSVLYNNNDSYIRVTLVDNSNYEFLVYENYPLLSDSLKTTFSNIALETVLLNDISPQCLNISIYKASIELLSINFSTAIASKGRDDGNLTMIQKKQTQYIVDMLNANLEKRKMTWRAGMTSMSNKSFSEKKDMFGGKVPKLYGFEHYIGGVFVLPGNSINSMPKSLSSDQYVSEWDWRDRHGKNWMTAIRRQSLCNSCWAFSAIGTFESYINLYYNQILNYDLSEQEIISCGNAGNCQNGGSLSKSLSYIQNMGSIPEECFQYTATNDSCCNKCTNPADELSFEQYQRVNTIDEDSIKRILFRGPICFGIYPWWHFVVLAGYKQIYGGENYFTINNHNFPILILPDNPIIGHPAWLIKNSWGSDWGDNGYGYVAMSLNDAYEIYKLSGNVTSQILADNDIVCEDADGDGYYFWGLGPKPSKCPSWVPDTQDGNDNNSAEGKMYQNSPNIIGNLETLTPDNYLPLQITGNTIYDTPQSVYTNVRINNSAIMTIQNVLNLFGRVIINIESGGELVIDGGVITNADIVMAVGGKLTIKNNGKLVMRTNTNFEVPLGAVVEIGNGVICKSNDF